MSTVFIDIIACSYILYFSNMKEGLPRLFWTILCVGTLLFHWGYRVAYQRLILKDYYTFVDPSDFFIYFLISFAFAFLYEIIYNRDLLEKLL